MFKRNFIVIILAAVAALTVGAQEPGGQRFINLDVHALAGGSYTTNNYMDCFSEISDMNSSMGPSFGLGVGAALRLGSHWSLGTEANFSRNSRRMDLAVAGAGKPSVSNVFQRNSYWEIDVPLYMRWRMAMGDNIDWSVDLGMYYAYGTGGTQRNTIYDAKTNDLGQLITTRTNLESGYYNDAGALVNSYRRGDIGFHIATALTFARHFTVGVRTHLGLKNVAYSRGIVDPSCHNITIHGVMGWRF